MCCQRTETLGGLTSCDMSPTRSAASLRIEGCAHGTGRFEGFGFLRSHPCKGGTPFAARANELLRIVPLTLTCVRGMILKEAISTRAKCRNTQKESCCECSALENRGFGGRLWQILYFGMGLNISGGVWTREPPLIIWIDHRPWGSFGIKNGNVGPQWSFRCCYQGARVPRTESRGLGLYRPSKETLRHLAT